MHYNFDEYVERRGTASVKWDSPKYRDSGMIPMWVADMDFKSPVEVTEALKERADHGVFGYTFCPDELNETVMFRLKKLYNWDIRKEWIVWLPGLVTGLNVACRSVAARGGNAATACPVYPPFLSAPTNNALSLIKTRMIEDNSRWLPDYDMLKSSLNEKTRMFLLCNPHNPGGTMYTQEELLKLYGILAEKDIVICSDEIHCDLILEKTKKHIPMASLSPEIAGRTITLMAPSKTFNIAGMGCSFAVIPNEQLRKNFIKASDGLVPLVNTLGYTAALAAYKHGDEWLAQLLAYLRGNYQYVKDTFGKIPGFRMLNHEGTYLAWIDTRTSGIQNPVGFFEKAGVGVANGADFDGQGFVRLNFGCPRSLLEEAFKRVISG